MTKPTHFFSRPRLWGLLCGLTLAVAQLFTPAGGMGTAQAATLTVTSTADSGAGSLRQAIANAAPGDTITFALPNPSTITLGSELVIAKNLTISGPGAAALTISGNNATRVFFINPGAAGATSGPPATPLTVQISGLTIANGKAQGGAGGVRASAGGSGGAAGMGGALFSNHGNLTISGVVFDANQAQGGNSTGGGVSFFGAAGGGGVGGNGGEGVFAGGGGGSGGALGGNGGGGGAAGIFLPDGSNGGNGAAGGEGAGGGGGGIGDDCPGSPCTGPGANGGKGGNGGFGGGAGGGGASGKDTSGSAAGGSGGAGGFGGGGGGGGSSQNFFGPAGAGGAGGAFGGNGGSSAGVNGGSGGGGAGLGGAIFVRAGSLTLVDSSFSNNSAAGGSGAQNGQGKGGALFILSPATLNLACTTFSGNSATNAAGSANDTNDRYGSVASTTPCDSTGPVITAQVSGTAGTNGWYTSNVNISWTVVDNESTITSQSGCETQNITSDTAGVTFTCSATSAGGSSSESITIKRDATVPVVTVTGVTAGVTYTVGSVPTAACSTTDVLSGVATQATLSLTGGNPDGTGSFTATCSGATDLAGNSAAPVSVNYSVNPPPDTTAPVITAQVNGTPGNNDWYVSDVTVSWTVVDDESTISSQSGCETQNITGDTSGVTFTCSATSLGGSSSESVTIKRDATVPTISAAATTASNANGWYNSNVTVDFTCADNLSGVTSCPTDEILSGEGSTVSSTAQSITDLAGNQSTASNVVTVKIDKTAPVVTVTGVSDGVNYTQGSVPTAGCSTSDALSGVATQATLSLTGGNPDGTGNFTATCSGATDVAGNSAVPVSVSYTVTAPVDACTTTALRDDFNRANGGLGSNWTGLTGQSFYKIASNRVDVQLGGPVLWKPTNYGVNQAAFVTLSTLDNASPAQGVLLKVQSGTIPNAGAIAVVYDSLAKAVRISTLRLNTPAWTTYGNTPATFANGDKLLGCVQANGTVRVYRNNTLLTTVTLNSADQGFFNVKGGKIGLWTVAAANATFDDFGGGALSSISSATLDAPVPDEVADDGAEITVAVDFPTDDTAAPDADNLVNRLFLPLVTR